MLFVLVLLWALPVLDTCSLGNYMRWVIESTLRKKVIILCTFIAYNFQNASLTILL